MIPFSDFFRHRVCRVKATARFFGAALLCSAWLHPAQAQEESSSWRNREGIVVVVGAPFIELYVEPGRGYARFHAVEKNERLRLFKTRTDWFKVETEDGKVGWVPRRALVDLYDTEGYPLELQTPSWSEAQYPWQLGLLAGEMAGASTYSVYGGYRFTSNISAEIKYTQAFGDTSNTKLTSLMLVHQPFPHWRASPFFTLGAGNMKIFRDGVLVKAEDEKDNAVTVGGGLMFYVTHKIIARLEYNQHTLLTTRDNNEEVEEWKAGFSVLF
jgi:opacity protein-like surface antigen